MSLPWWRFMVLLEGLPREARYWIDRTEGRSLWGPTEHLLALVADHLAQLGWQDAVAKFKDVPKKPPKSLPRPGMRRTIGQTGLGGAEMIARLREQAERHAKG